MGPLAYHSAGDTDGARVSVNLVPGERFGAYTIEAELGRGGQAVVYRARERGTERPVALKVFAEIDDAARLARFRREAVAAARVEHPRIVTVFGSGDVDGVPFLATRLIPGPSLAEVLARFGALAPGRALDILSDVAEAVDAAHDHGLVHRDIKPANVLLDLDERAYLSDFGIAFLGDMPRLTARGDLLGTVEYTSPEQASGGPATSASDIYAFGILAFEVLTGRPPFVHRQISAVLVAHVNDEPPSVRRLVPSLPAAVDAVLGRVLAKDPAVRPARARDVVAALRRAIGTDDRSGGTLVMPAPASDGLTAVLRSVAAGTAEGDDATRVIPAGAPAGAAPTPARPRRRRPLRAGLLAVVLCGGGLAGGWAVAERTHDDSAARGAAFRNGFAAGKAKGTAQGRVAGYTAGKKDGYSAGRKDGFASGKVAGIAEGRMVPDANPGQFRVAAVADDGTADYRGDAIAAGGCFKIDTDGSVSVLTTGNPFSICSGFLQGQ